MKTVVSNFWKKIQKSYGNKYHIIVAIIIGYYCWLIAPAIMAGRIIIIKPEYELKFIAYTLFLTAPIILGAYLFVILQRKWMKMFLLFFIGLWLGGEIFLTIIPLRKTNFYPVLKPDPYVGSIHSDSSRYREQLHFLFEGVVDKHPDLVVFYNGGNAVMQPIFWDPRPGYPLDFFVFERGSELIRG